MSGHVTYESRDEILVVRVVGEVNFGAGIYHRMKELLGKVKEHVAQGGRGVLFELSGLQLGDPASCEFLGLPFMQTRERCRTAAVFGANHDLHESFKALGIEAMVDCFESTTDAIRFLKSDDKQIDPDQHDHLLWDSIGKTAGHEPCDQAGCQAPKVRFSSFCRSHHYIMLKGVRYIGDRGPTAE